MAYRNGTYIAFHADGTNQPGKSDIDYYNLMKAWTARTDDDFTMINSHEKTSAVRDTSKRTTLRARLLERLRNSKNMVLIVGVTTKNDTDWVPLEIAQAIDTYQIPIIAAYTDYASILTLLVCVRLASGLGSTDRQSGRPCHSHSFQESTTAGRNSSL